MLCIRAWGYIDDVDDTTTTTTLLIIIITKKINKKINK